MDAAVGVTRLRTKGRLRVRDMRASYLGSASIFRVLALAEERKVPVLRKAKVEAEAEKVVLGEARAAVLLKISGRGYSE